ncbi:MAG: class I SAM-dependent methyltransferase [Ornithinimicrobium sp.]
MSENEPSFSDIVDVDISKEEAFAANRVNWDERAAIHSGSTFYGVDELTADPTALSSVVAQDLPVLKQHLHGGTLSGLHVLHLQCHIGTDTLSLARAGGILTGIDFSAGSLAVARDLAQRSGLSIRYVESNVEQAAKSVGEQFDVVYTSIGTICWLPDLGLWAQNVSALMKPGGVFYIRDSHPMLRTLDDVGRSPLTVANRYFRNGQTQQDDEYETYTGGEGASLQNTRSYDWPHAMSETLQALLNAGLRLVRLDEGRSLPFQGLPEMVEDEATGDYVLPAPWDERVPLTLTIIATKD